MGQMNVSERGLRKEGRLVVVRGNRRQLVRAHSVLSFCPENKTTLAMSLLVNSPKVTQGSGEGDLDHNHIVQDFWKALFALRCVVRMSGR